MQCLMSLGPEAFLSIFTENIASILCLVVVGLGNSLAVLGREGA